MLSTHHSTYAALRRSFRIGLILSAVGGTAIFASLILADNKMRFFHSEAAFEVFVRSQRPIEVFLPLAGLALFLTGVAMAVLARCKRLDL